MKKFIITESEKMRIRGLHLIENDNVDLRFKRRLSILLDLPSKFIDDQEEFYLDADFCNLTFEEFLNDLVYDATSQLDDEDFYNYIKNELGQDRFIKLLMGLHGEKILNFYEEKTKDCVDEW